RTAWDTRPAASAGSRHSQGQRLGFREHLPEVAEAVEPQPRFAGFALGDLAFQKGLELGQGTLEFLHDAHHRAGVFDTFNRFFKDVDLNHRREILFDAPCSYRRSCMACKASMCREW